MENDAPVTFKFTSEQEASLQRWKGYLSSQQAQEWATDEKDAIDSIHTIFIQAGFK